MRLSMDEIINAVCLHLAERHQVPVTAVEVELMYDDELGFNAEAWVEGRSRYLVEANLKEAITRYLLTEYGQRVFPDQIRLELNEEIEAAVMPSA
ncbi:MAG TPA: DUF2653 family protein [Paenibacillaceae bacterium]